MKTEKDYIQLLDSFLRKEDVSVEERQSLLEWFTQPEAKQQICTFYEKRWEEVSSEISVSKQVDMFAAIQEKINAEEESHSSRKPVMKRIFNAFKQYAAVACFLIITVGIGTYYFSQQSFYSAKEFVVATGKGQKANITLPDGTLVWINSDSRITYDNSYNRKNRRLSLDGEAYFEVAKDKDKRFIVSTNNIDIEALGTSFDVKSYATDNSVIVALVEGRLKVSNEKTETFMRMNERLVYDRSSNAFKKTNTYDVANVAGWRNGEIAFYDESLEEIAIILSRMYNIEIIFTTEKAKQYHFQGRIKNNSLGNIFEMISLTAPIEYKIYDNVVEVSERK